VIGLPARNHWPSMLPVVEKDQRSRTGPGFLTGVTAPSLAPVRGRRAPWTVGLDGRRLRALAVRALAVVAGLELDSLRSA